MDPAAEAFGQDSSTVAAKTYIQTSRRHGNRTERDGVHYPLPDAYAFPVVHTLAEACYRGGVGDVASAVDVAVHVDDVASNEATVVPRSTEMASKK